MLSRFRRALFDNLGLKIFAFFVAVILFRYVRGEQNRISTVEVKLLYKNLEGLMMVSEPVSQLRVTLRGPETKLRGVDSSPLSYTFDFKDPKPGPYQHQLYIEQLRSLFPAEVQVIRLTPSVLDFTLERKSKRTLPLRVQTKGQLPFGYALIEPLVVFPSEITLEGAESTLKRLQEARTQPIDLTGQSKDIIREIPLEPLGRHVFVVGQSQARVKIGIRQIQKRKIFKKIPLRITNFPENTRKKLTLSTESIDVTIFGPIAQLQPLKPEDIAAEVDAKEMTTKEEGLYPLPLRFRLPAPDLKVVTPPTPAEVKVRVAVSPLPPQKTKKEPKETNEKPSEREKTTKAEPPPRRRKLKRKPPPRRIKKSPNDTKTKENEE
jgi:YbbR domain-containing protein